MKRWTAIFLALCLMFSLMGCNRENPEPPKVQSGTQQEKPNNSNEGTSQSVSQLPMYSVSLPFATQEETAKDGTVIFQYIYPDNVQLLHSNTSAVSKVKKDFLSRIDKSAADAKVLVNQAKQAYAKNPLNWTPYLCQLQYNPMRIDKKILSLFGSYTTYSGIHPETTYPSVSYDLATGKIISFGDILSKSAKTDTLCQLVIDILKIQKEDKFIDDSFEDTVKDRFGSHIADDSDWYFTPTGLCFYFAPYEIAPYTSGVIVAEIPYEKLTGIIKDAYFPAEREAAKGNIVATPFASSDSENFTQLSEIVLSKSGEKLLLHTDHIIYDVRIATEDRKTIFAAASLSPGDGILLQADFASSKLYLQHTTDSGVVFHSIGADGTLSKWLTQAWFSTAPVFCIACIALPRLV